MLARYASRMPARIGGDVFRALEIREARRRAERERQLVRIEQLEDDDVAAAELQVLEAGDDRLRVVEQVRNQHDQAAPHQRLRELVQRPPDVRAGAPGVSRSSASSRLCRWPRRALARQAKRRSCRRTRSGRMRRAGGS